jgi:two-component system cell cycle response regulator DivK
MSARSPLVLLVDDYRDSLLMYDKALSDAGYRTVTCQSATEMFAALRDLRPDIVVTEVALRGIAPAAFLQDLSAFRQRQDFATVLLSGAEFGREEDEALTALSDAFLRKPCLPGTLVLEVRRVLQRRGTACVEALRPMGAASLALPTSS